MSAQSQPRLTPEQYLELERAGGTHPHAIVIANLGRHLGNALAEQPCVVTTSDIRVRIRENGLYAYPDVVVVCGSPRYGDDRDETVLNPILILEVLSPLTEAYDRGFKFAQYRALESLQEYALVSHSEPRVEIFRRQPSGDWLLSEAAGMEAVCRFHSVGWTVAIRDVYDKVTFEDEAVVGNRPSPGTQIRTRGHQ